MRIKYILPLFCIVILAAVFRFAGVNWDDNAHLHPDERFLTMVATNIEWPTSLTQYFDTKSSPINPQNRGFSFFVYGTYPIYLTKLVATLVHQDTYDGIPIVGRVLSGIIDLLTLVTVYLIASYTAKNKRAGLIASFCYGLFVLPIQLSHFFTVDPYVTLFTTLVLWRILRNKFDVLTGILLAFAVGAKASAILILPIIALAYLTTWPWTRNPAFRNKQYRLLLGAITCAVAFLLTLRIIYPYLFTGWWTVNPLILENWKQLSSFDSPTTTFPPGLQWINTTPLQPILALLIWGMGIPLGLLSMIAITKSIGTIIQKNSWLSPVIIILAWIYFLGFYQAFQFAKPMRYFWPIYPSIAVLIGIFLSTVHIKSSLNRSIGTITFCIVCLIWPIAFVHIYLTPTTRISANTWIYTHIPKGSTIAWESWDDPLPFPRSGLSPSWYHTPSLPVFDPDSPEKWSKITATLSQADYIILSSNRGYGAIGQAKNRYPETLHYYERLFGGSLGFKPVAQFSSRPTIPFPYLSVCANIPGFSYGFLSRPFTTCPKNAITILDDGTDETFTVYDHPGVIIFQKIR